VPTGYLKKPVDALTSLRGPAEDCVPLRLAEYGSEQPTPSSEPVPGFWQVLQEILRQGGEAVLQPRHADVLETTAFDAVEVLSDHRVLTGG
jgi:hypothetical protein